MNSKERLLAAFRGEEVDRVPIWLREGFPVLTEPAEADDRQNGWQAEPRYRELHAYVTPHADAFAGWGIGSLNRLLVIPSRYVRNEVVSESPDRRRTRITIDTPGGPLTSDREAVRGQATGWQLDPPVKNEEDLRKLASVPFEINPDEIAAARKRYHEAREKYGGQVLLKGGVSSCIVCISGAMDFKMFLEFSLTKREWFHELLEEITRRSLAILEAVFGDEEFDTVMNMGGSEQCTPPMMPPRMFDEYVVPYDGQIVEFFRNRNIPVQIHCHGKVRHALRGMLEMGADATDPVEPPPAGDVTYAEAREIAGDRLTLIGNLEFDFLESAEPVEVREHVKEVLSHGNRRLILGSSAGPISAVTPRLVDNYKAWVDTALEFGA